MAHALARMLGCPAICRDEIKEGMAYRSTDFVPAVDDTLSRRTYTAFFEVLEVLLRAGATVIAEAAFQDHLWRPPLEVLSQIAEVRIIECVVDDDVAQLRQSRRDRASDVRQSAHVANWRPASFAWISLDVPKLRVDTTDGYAPELSSIVNFLNQPSADSD